MYNLLAIRVEWVMIKKVTMIISIKVLLSMDNLLRDFPSPFVVNRLETISSLVWDIMLRTISSLVWDIMLRLFSLCSCCRELWFDCTADIIDCPESCILSFLCILVFWRQSIFLWLGNVDSPLSFFLT